MLDIPEDRLKELQTRLTELEGKVKQLSHCGGMLSSSDLDKYLVKDQDKVNEYKKLAQKGEWDEIDKKFDRMFVVDPWEPLNLTPFSYDLSLGDEICTIRRGSYVPQDLSEEFYDSKKQDVVHSYKIPPGETLIVKNRRIYCPSEILFCNCLASFQFC